MAGEEEVTAEQKESRGKPRAKRQRKRPRTDGANDNEVHSTIVPISDYDDTTLRIRVVLPYAYTYNSFCKGRWVGKSVLDVYTQEFGWYPASYYDNAIRQGRIQVSGNIVSPDTVVQRTDVLSHTVHRHEPAVAAALMSPPYVKIVAETNELVAVDKPATLPVHACGNYHHNSLINLLLLKDRRLFPIHRLDRLTSGLVVLAKTSESAKVWSKAMVDRNCQKIYLARVRGRFGASLVQSDSIPRLSSMQPPPLHGEWSDDDDETTAATAVVRKRKNNAHGYWFTDSAGNKRDDVALNDFAKKEHTVDEILFSLDSKSSSDDAVWLNLACPVRVQDPKKLVCEAGTFADLDDTTYEKTVKAAHTLFAVVTYNEKDDSTLLLVRPTTGRTHQIRIHLQYLGHCIANDPNYGGDMWFGNPNGKRACERAQKILDYGAEGGANLVSADSPATEEEVERAKSIVRRPDESLEQIAQRACVWCARNDASNQTAEERAKLEFLVRSPGLWLHALRYRVGKVSFRTDMPSWSEF